MPTYEYACKACDHRFDIEQSFYDDALTDCPECSGGTLRKVFSAAGIIFKGSGWHVKDYAGSSSTKTTSETTDSESTKKPDAGADSTTSTSKPDPAPSTSKPGAAPSTSSSTTN